jgi:phosphoglycolate phosphatase
MPYSVVLFDLDGTLTDPYVGITRSLAHALAAAGRPVDDPDTLRSLIGPPLVDAFAEMGMNDAAIDIALTAYRDRYTKIGMFENELIAGVPQLLRDLVAAGFRLAVATSKPEEFARTIVEHFDLAAYFEAVAGATLDNRRSHKDEVIDHALDLLGRPAIESVVMIGDREHDLIGAAEHHIASIGVLWGYGSRAELAAARPMALVATVDELRSVLLGQTEAGPGGSP